MNIEQIEQLKIIYNLLNTIKWPEDAEIYVSMGDKVNGKYPGPEMSVYISKFNEDRSCHKKDSFGSYFSVVAKHFDVMISMLNEKLSQQIEETKCLKI
jgi:hypothetical protein